MPLVLRLVRLVLVAAVLGLLLARAISSPYSQDLQADYLTALALREGVDPLTPLTDLSARYFPVEVANFPHASPHPQIATVLFVPLTLIPYPALVILWLLISLGILVWIGHALGVSPMGSLALVALPPLFVALDGGQWEVALLALCLLGWRAAARGQDIRAGLWLGLAACLKLYPALLLLPFLLQHRLRAVLASGTLFLASQTTTAILLGPDSLRRYWLEVLPSVGRYYVGLGLNSSVYGAGLRLFGGAADLTPLVDIPWLPLPLTVGCGLLALFWLRRSRPDAWAPLLLVVMPTAWTTYAVLSLPAAIHSRLRLALPLAWSFVLALTVLGITGATVSVATLALLGCVQPLGALGMIYASRDDRPLVRRLAVG